MKLELRGITKRFPGVIANDNVNLELNTGEVLSLKIDIVVCNDTWKTVQVNPP